MMSGSIRVGANGFSLFSFVSELQSIVYMYPIFFIHSSVHGRSGCFRFLAIVRTVAMNIEVLVSS